MIFSILIIGDEVVAIIVSCRLQFPLSVDKIIFEFASSPNANFHDGSYSIKLILQLKKKYDLDTWIIFADLLKVFDTIHHKLMSKLLGKCGILKYII